MKLPRFCALALATSLPALAAVEEPIDHRFKPASTDPLLGDWQGAGGVVAQVTLDEHGDYQANLLKAFDAENSLVATLHGQATDGHVALRGGGWSGTIESGHFKGAAKDGASFDLQRAVRPSPTMGATAPAGAVVLFDGKSMDAFANKNGKDWLTENGPAPWKIVDGVLEVVPGTGGGIITHQKFGDCHLHVEFRTLGAPSNSGVFLETRYEADIGENYGQHSKAEPTATSATARPRARRPACAPRARRWSGRPSTSISRPRGLTPPAPRPPAPA